MRVKLFDVKNYKFMNFFIWDFVEPIYDILGVFPLAKAKIFSYC